MNERLVKIGTSIAAGALAFSLPAIAFAQDGAAEPAQDTMKDATMPVVIDVAPAVSQADQLDRLASLGYLSDSALKVVALDPNAPNDFDALPPDQLQATLDKVMVTNGDGISSTLREYLVASGAPPSSIVGVHVIDGTAVIVYNNS